MLASMIGDLLYELVDGLDRSHTLYAAYKGAWKKRQQTGDDDLELLVAEMKERSVPGAYDTLDSPRILPAVRAWEAGLEPSVARQMIRAASNRRPSRD